jgi:DDE_Tnp_1-associated
MASRVANVEFLASYFESLSDPRRTRNRKHLLLDIVVIAVCGSVRGCDGPTAIRRWATNRADWLNGVRALPKGIPSRDCIRRLLIALRRGAFQRCFRDWIANAIVTDEGNVARLVAIDGTTARRSHDAAKGRGPLHIVSAWAS